MLPLAIGFALVEVLIVIAIIVLVVLLFGEEIAKLFGGAKAAGGSYQYFPSWINPPPTIPPAPQNAQFVFQLQRQKIDGKKQPIGTKENAPSSTAVSFTLTMVQGNGAVISMTFDGNPIPLTPVQATPKKPAVVPGGTDGDGLITVGVSLEQNAQATLTASESPDPRLPGWTAPPISFSAP